MEKNITMTCPVCGTEISVNAVCKHTPKSAEERINALRATGMDVSNLFAMTGSNGGSYVASNRDGKLMILSDDDPIWDSIVKSGTVPNRKLFRRWVMAQMFRMLTTTEWRSNKPIGFTQCMKNKGYEYTWHQMKDELYAQMKMVAHGDMKSYEERNVFFDKNVATEMAHDYIQKFRDNLMSRKTRKCKGLPYITIKGKNVFVADIDSKIIRPLQVAGWDIAYAKTAEQLYNAFVKFDKMRHKMNWRTPQCAAWIDAYKGSGAFFTLQNMIRFHNCRIYDKKGRMLNEFDSLEDISARAKMYSNEGWRMLGVLKQCLKDNHVDIKQKMAEWRKK